MARGMAAIQRCCSRVVCVDLTHPDFVNRRSTRPPPSLPPTTRHPPQHSHRHHEPLTPLTNHRRQHHPPPPTTLHVCTSRYPKCTISPDNWNVPYCLCGGRFKLCTECSAPAPPAPPSPSPSHKHFVPTNITDCTYVPGAAYDHRVSHGAVREHVSSKSECCRQCYMNDECVVAAWHDTAPVVHACYLHFSAAGSTTNQSGVVGCVTDRSSKP